MYQLKLSLQQAIITLRKNGWSHRAIARELGIDRGTVGKHLRLDSKSATEVPAGSDPPKPAISTSGSETDTPSNSAKVGHYKLTPPSATVAPQSVVDFKNARRECEWFVLMGMAVGRLKHKTADRKSNP